MRSEDTLCGVSEPRIVFFEVPDLLHPVPLYHLPRVQGLHKVQLTEDEARLLEEICADREDES